MFHTLKAKKLSDTSYSFETTGSHVPKKRDRNLAKVACTKCRSSKLKCSGDANGCERCRIKNLHCHYPNPAVRCSDEKKVPTPPESPRDTSSTSTTATQETVESGLYHDWLMPSNQGSMDNSILQDSCPQFDVADLPTTADDMKRLLSSDDGSNPWQQLDLYHLTAFTSNTPCSGTLEPNIANFGYDDKSWPIVPTATSVTRTSICHCTDQAVVTLEAIEVAVWGHGKVLDTLDALQAHKIALAECESLVDCQNCNVQPAFMMLLLSMLRKILSTLEHLSHTKTTSNPHLDPTDMDLDSQDKTTTTPLDSCEDEKQAHRLRGSGNADQIELDDEDKHIVLQSLRSARISKTQQILNMIDKLVSQHPWPAHKDFVRELQGRLAGGSLVMH